jgi:hypothetical protein
MNRNLRKSIWVSTLGIAFTGLSTPSLVAAVPAPQDQDQDRNQNQPATTLKLGIERTFSRACRTGSMIVKYGDNHSDRQQPYNAEDLRAYQDGYKQGFRNTASAPKGQGRAIRFWRTRRT